MTTMLEIGPVDTWFFREARPYDMVGGRELSSSFPPPARTVAGAIRRWIGEIRGVDWRAFGADARWQSLRDLIGSAGYDGSLATRGPHVFVDGLPVVPAPAYLVRSNSAGIASLIRLFPGKPVRCDLGYVRLMDVPNGTGAVKAVSGWIGIGEMEAVLAGGTIPAASVIAREHLVAEEARLGIARRNRHRTAANGMLYQTRHLRPRRDISVGVEVPKEIASELSGACGPLGGEGRCAGVERSLDPVRLSPQRVSAGDALTLTFLTHADLGPPQPGVSKEIAWLPSGFRLEERDGVRVWRGEIHGVTLIVEAVAAEKPVREGGWDLARGSPRAARSLVAAGTTWFCRVEGNAQEAATRLHHAQIGRETSIGRGEVVVGIWPEGRAA